MTSPAVLLLADGRLPTGGHRHSAGFEAAAAFAGADSLDDLADFVGNRLHTVGLTDAAIAANLLAELRRGVVPSWPHVAAEVDARLPVPAIRAASREQGRSLLRAATRLWGPMPEAPPTDHVHHPTAWAVVAAHQDLTTDDVARLVLHHLATAAVTAAVRLLGRDPFAAHGVVAAHAATIDALAAEAVRWVGAPLAVLPARTTPVQDWLAHRHRDLDPRLFAT